MKISARFPGCHPSRPKKKGGGPPFLFDQNTLKTLQLRLLINVSILCTLDISGVLRVRQNPRSHIGRSSLGLTLNSDTPLQPCNKLFVLKTSLRQFTYAINPLFHVNVDSITVDLRVMLTSGPFNYVDTIFVM